MEKSPMDIPGLSVYDTYSIVIGLERFAGVPP
jgi:hypothetical protein